MVRNLNRYDLLIAVLALLMATSIVLIGAH